MVVPEKGADIYSRCYKPREMDVLWKSPWGFTPSGLSLPFAGGNTEAAWMDQYEGGWQEIFPNGGDECLYRNAPLNFHCEASTLSCAYTIRNSSSSSVSWEFHVTLHPSPF